MRQGVFDIDIWKETRKQAFEFLKTGFHVGEVSEGFEISDSLDGAAQERRNHDNALPVPAALHT